MAWSKDSSDEQSPARNFTAGDPELGPRDLIRKLLAVLTVGSLAVVFATTDGENIQAVVLPVALVYACWWATGPLPALTFVRPPAIAGGS